MEEIDRKRNELEEMIKIAGDDIPTPAQMAKELEIDSIYNIFSDSPKPLDSYIYDDILGAFDVLKVWDTLDHYSIILLFNSDIHTLRNLIKEIRQMTYKKQLVDSLRNWPPTLLVFLDSIRELLKVDLYRILMKKEKKIDLSDICKKYDNMLDDISDCLQK